MLACTAPQPFYDLGPAFHSNSRSWPVLVMQQLLRTSLSLLATQALDTLCLHFLILLSTELLFVFTVLYYTLVKTLSGGMNKAVLITWYRILSCRMVSYLPFSCPFSLSLSALWETRCVQLLCVRTAQMVLKQENVGD